MVEVLVLLAVLVAVGVALAAHRRRSSPDDRAAARTARVGKLAAEQAHIARQGGQGAGQGGFGGGLGS